MNIKVPIANPDGSLREEREIEAEQVGPLAVHESVKSPGMWIVTHIRSGRGLGVEFCCRESAVALAQRLEGFDWDFTLTRKKEHARLPKRVVSSMDAVRAIRDEWQNPCAKCRRQVQ